MPDSHTKTESELDAVLAWAVDPGEYPHPVLPALRERDALRARVAQLEAQAEIAGGVCLNLNAEKLRYLNALDEIFLRSMSSTCTFNEIQTIVSHAKGVCPGA